MCAFMPKVPKNVTVDGINVGGKPLTEACRIIRESIEERLKEKSLVVCGREKYVFTYPEIYYRDNLQKLLKTVKRNGSYTVEVNYYLNGISEIATSICRNESIAMVEPYAKFNAVGAPFTYFDGRDGRRADRAKLIEDICASLNGGFEEVKVSLTDVPRTISRDEIKSDTKLLSTFTTYFDSSNEGRAHNIRLAARSVNGTCLNKGESFSFNASVGERTVGRGYRTAKIIERGEFVEGIGGGVCQVSTTLYNAALLAGCDITEFHPHSLAVSYVAPSRDAMVSGSSFDLKFTNNTNGAIYIRAYTGEGSVTFSLYGRGTGAAYSFSSLITGTVEAPVETTDDVSRVREGKDGIISEGYLTVIKDGVRVTKLYRRDKYAPVKRIDFLSDGGDAQG